MIKKILMTLFIVLQITVGYACAADWYWAGHTDDGKQLYIDNASVTRNAVTAYVWTKMDEVDGSYSLVRYRVDKGAKRLGIVAIKVYAANNAMTLNWKATNVNLTRWIDIIPKSGAERIYNLTWGSNNDRALKTYLWNLKQFKKLLQKTYMKHENGIEKIDTPEKFDDLIHFCRAMIDNLDNLHVPNSAKKYHSLEKERIVLHLKLLLWMKENNIPIDPKNLESDDMKQSWNRIVAIEKEQQQIRKTVANLP